MFTLVWWKQGSKKLIPSTITLCAYYKRSSQPKGLFQNVLVELAGETILIYIEVVNAPLNDNIILGHSYMYTMKAVVSLLLHTMMFSHDGKIITLDQLTYYEPRPPMNLYNVFITIEANQHLLSYIEMGPDIFKDSTPTWDLSWCTS